MFDSVPSVAEINAASAAGLIDAARICSRAENIAAYRKLAVLAELFDRRTQLPSARDRENWFLDPDRAVAAELAAALGVTQGLALAQTDRAVALRDRLPKVAALFAQGLISDLVVRTIVYRTGLIGDPDLMAAVDAALAAQVGFWGRLSREKIDQAIDATVITHDPAAHRVPRHRQAERGLQIGDPADPPGFQTVWARMNSSDAAALGDRIEAIARTVCQADPRPLDERRNDALAAIGYGLDALACGCGLSDCHAANNPAPTPNTFIYVVTDTTTLHTAKDHAHAQPAPDAAEQEPTQTEPADSEQDEAQSPEPEAEPEPEPEPGTEDGSASRAELRPQPAEEQSPPQAEVDADPAQDEDETEDEDEDEAEAEDTTGPEPASPVTSATASSPKAALIFGAGLVPAAGLHPLLGNARIREIIHPGDSPAEPRYLPSRALAEFIRCRDLTCRFPLCDIAATKADIDHTVPHPIGPTHASNLKCLCRFHHLLKTFWCGPDGWTDRQYPDGTIKWVSPTGHTYLTKPGSALLFPALCKPTATLWTNGPPPPPPTDQRRGIMMPRRRYTRAQAQTRYNQVLRRINEAALTNNGDQLLPPPNDAPPF